MNNITDDQLKSILAKMLPETVAQHALGKYYWINSANGFVLDTELLYICSYVEAGLTVEESHDYLDALARIVDPMFGYRGELTLGIITATWQQRTRALAEVLEVTL